MPIYAIKNQLKASHRGTSYVSLVLNGVRIGGFHARKGSITVFG